VRNARCAAASISGADARVISRKSTDQGSPCLACANAVRAMTLAVAATRAWDGFTAEGTACRGFLLGRRIVALRPKRMC